MERIAGGIDLPEAGSALDPRGLRVWGWAYRRVNPVSRVDLFLGDHWLGRAGLARPRPDVALALADADAGLSGFELNVAGPPLPASGQTWMQAVVTAVDGGQQHLAPVAVRFRPAAAPAGTGGPIGPVATATRPAADRVAEARRRAGDAIRLLVSARGLDQGGSQLRMAELMEHLGRDGGFATTVLSPTDGPLRPLLEAAGATVRVGLAVPLDDAGAYERSLSRLGEWIRGRFDLVVGFTGTSFAAVDAAGRVGLPSLLRIGESEPLRTVVGWLAGRLDPGVEQRARRAVEGATAVLSNSHAAVASYRADGYSGRFVVLANGADTAAAREYIAATDRQECRRRLGVKPDDRLLLCGAALWTVKGQALLVWALDHLRREHPHLTCVLIGLDFDGYAGAISSLVERRGLGEMTRVLPFDRDLRRWWRAADAAVCPSETEALPTAVLEAMAFGLPVLACRVGDLPRLVEPGVNGWLCDHSDLGSMISALETVATSSPGRLREMGAAAAQRVAGSYDLAVTLARTTRLLRAAAERRLPDFDEFSAGQTSYLTD